MWEGYSLNAACIQGTLKFTQCRDTVTMLRCDPTGAEKQTLSQHYWICWGEQNAYKASYLWDGEVEEKMLRAIQNSSTMLLMLVAQTRIHYSTVQEDILNICVNTGYVVGYFKADWWCLTGRKYVRESRMMPKLCVFLFLDLFFTNKIASSVTPKYVCGWKQ